MDKDAEVASHLSVLVHPSHEGKQTMSVHHVDLSTDAEELRKTGTTVAIHLPDGHVIDLWIFDDPGKTSSVDVRFRAYASDINGESDRCVPMVRHFGMSPHLSGVHPPLAIVAVLR